LIRTSRYRACSKASSRSTTVSAIIGTARTYGDAVAERAADRPEDVHLRSCKDVEGYHIAGTDDEIGHVEDFICDDEAWAIRYMLVDTRNWWPGGKKVLLATHWVDRIDWTDSTVQTALTRDQIKDSPEYDENLPLDRDYETRLHRYYGRKEYWD
jgi:hypothetical protein